MLLDAGASLTIVGHSERRDAQRESDAEVKAKAEAALSAGLAVILCVGESLEVREAGGALADGDAQLDGSLPGVRRAEAELAIAYEPIWAIGTGKIPTHRRDRARCMPRSAQRCRERYGDAGDSGPNPLWRLGQSLERRARSSRFPTWMARSSAARA